MISNYSTNIVIKNLKGNHGKDHAMKGLGLMKTSILTPVVVKENPSEPGFIQIDDLMKEVIV